MREMPKFETLEGADLKQVQDHNIEVLIRGRNLDRIDAERIVNEGFKVSGEVINSIAERIEKIFPGSTLRWEIWHFVALVVANNLKELAQNDLNEYIQETIAKAHGIEGARVVFIDLD